MGVYRFSTTLSSVVGSMLFVSSYMTNLNYGNVDDPRGYAPDYNQRLASISGRVIAQGWLNSGWLFGVLHVTDFNALCTAMGLTQANPTARISAFTLRENGVTPTYQTANLNITRPVIGSDECVIDLARSNTVYFDVLFRITNVVFY